MASHYLHVKCSCGRTLRAGKSRMGTTIRCWDCRGDVAVPLPALHGRLAAEMWDGLRDSANSETVGPCLGVALAALPLLWLGRSGLFLAFVLAAAFAYFRREEIAGAVRRSVAGARRYPAAAVFAALMLPAGLLAIEAGLVVVSYEQGWLHYLALDLSPRSSTVSVLGDANAGGFDFNLIDDHEVSRIYAHGLRRGFALLWTVPASLANGTAARPETGYAFANAAAWHDWVDPFAYLGFRSVLSVAALAGVFWLLVVLARWLELIGTLESRFLATIVAPPALDRWVEPAADGWLPATEAGRPSAQPWAIPTPTGLLLPNTGE